MEDCVAFNGLHQLQERVTIYPQVVAEQGRVRVGVCKDVRHLTWRSAVLLFSPILPVALRIEAVDGGSD